MITSLAERLRTETRALHTAAERSRFMGALLRGQVGRADYCALLRNLSAIYDALEPALLRHADEPLLRPVHDPALFRSAALARDLAALHGPRWAQEIPVLPATHDYVARLQQLDAAHPGRLLAHAYVRYLGDLSGGQMLRRVVAQSPALGGRGRHAEKHEAGGEGGEAAKDVEAVAADPRDDIGVAFYDFGDPATTRALTERFRRGLASLAPPVAEADALVAEARLAFELHQRLFDHLAEEIP